MFGERSLVQTTFTMAVLVGIAGVVAAHLLAKVTPPQQVAKAERPVKQSIEGLRSVLDPVATGSVKGQAKSTTIVLDPCTGERRR